MKIFIFISTISFLLVTQRDVYANAGVGLVLGQPPFFHAIFGLFLIVHLETLIINLTSKLLFREKFHKVKSMLWKANWVSFFLGLFFFIFYHLLYFNIVSKFLPFTLYVVPYLIAFGIFLAYVFTIIIEWPFIYRIIRSSKERNKIPKVGGKTFFMSFCCQTVSYLLCILPLYYITTSYEYALYSEFKPEKLSANHYENIDIYYISESGNKVYKKNLATLKRDEVSTIDFKPKKLKLYPKGYNKLGNIIWAIGDSGEKTIIKYFFEINPSGQGEIMRGEIWGLPTTGYGDVSFFNHFLQFTFFNITKISPLIVFQIVQSDINIIAMIDLERRKLYQIDRGSSPVVIRN